MYTIYDQNGNPHEMHHAVDVTEALRSEKFFKTPPSSGKQVEKNLEIEKSKSIPDLFKMSKQELVEYASSTFGVSLNVQDLKQELVLTIQDLESRRTEVAELEEEEPIEEENIPQKLPRQ